jgi:hypothetical protein
MVLPLNLHLSPQDVEKIWRNSQIRITFFSIGWHSLKKSANGLSKPLSNVFLKMEGALLAAI